MKTAHGIAWAVLFNPNVEEWIQLLIPLTGRIRLHPGTHISFYFFVTEPEVDIVICHTVIGVSHPSVCLGTMPATKNRPLGQSADN